MKIKLIYVIVVITAIASCSEKNTIAGKFIETAYMDSAVKPGDNFFEFVNGKWMDTAKIPETESGLGAFQDLYNRTRDRLHTILDSVSGLKSDKGSIAQQVGDFMLPEWIL